MNERSGFTLIEALTVVAIIGILASLTTYTVGQAQRFARDARRKSDLLAIGLGMRARYEAKTCDVADVGKYPDYPNSSAGVGQEGWAETRELSNILSTNDSCGAFSTFLARVPNDPRYQTDFPYRYNLTTNRKHYRITSCLERSSQSAGERATMSGTWDTLGGKRYEDATSAGSTPCDDSGNSYNYFVGD